MLVSTRNMKIIYNIKKCIYDMLQTLNFSLSFGLENYVIRQFRKGPRVLFASFSHTLKGMVSYRRVVQEGPLWNFYFTEGLGGQREPTPSVSASTRI